MRVRISYGVDIEDVPETVADLVVGSACDLRDALKMIERIGQDLEDCESNAAHILENIDKVRKKLSDIDLTIGDTEMIINGLKNYYEGEQNVSDGRSTMDSSGNSITPPSDPGEG